MADQPNIVLVHGRGLAARLDDLLHRAGSLARAELRLN
jgi:hypothetical protein